MPLRPTAPRHLRPVPSLRIALSGRRDAARAQSEIGLRALQERLADRGHRVDVVGPSLRSLWATVRRADVVFALEPGDIAAVLLARASGASVAARIDSDHGRAPRPVAAAVEAADALLAETTTAATRLTDQLGRNVDALGWGARTLRHVPADAVEALGLVPGGFHLLSGRLDDGARTNELVLGYLRSTAKLPLVVASALEDVAPRITRLVAHDGRVRVLASPIEDRVMDQLYAHALSSLQPSGSAGAETSLLRAMGAGTAVVVHHTADHREVVGTAGAYVRSTEDVATTIAEIESHPQRFADIGEIMRDRAQALFDWDVVAEQYESVAARIAPRRHAASYSEERARRKQIVQAAPLPTTRR